MKNDKKTGPPRTGTGQAVIRSTQRDRLALAGYPGFLFRLAASRRLCWTGAGPEPRRHD
jgi:hypothetical protein